MSKVEDLISRISVKHIRPSLDSFKVALEEAGLLHYRFKKIIVAGTNGKGSTAWIVYNLLLAHGINTGVFLSPHFCSITERVVISGRTLDEEEWINAIEDYFSLIKKHELTYYEVTAFMAFYFFKKYEVDYGVMEVGMGGRWDAVNVGPNDLAVITSISLDHTDFLGNTIMDILKEKIEVIKMESTTVVGVPESLRKDVLVKKAEKFVFIGDDVKWYRRNGVESIVYYLNNLTGLKFKYHPPNPSTAWSRNSVIAVTSVVELLKNNFELRKAILLLEKITMPGRWDVRIINGKKVLLDVAHNPSGWGRLFKDLKKYFSDKDTGYLFGVLKDKRWKYLFKKAPEEKIFYFETGPVERRLSFEEVKKSFPLVKKAENPYEVISGTDFDSFVVTGSFYSVAEILCDMRKKALPLMEGLEYYLYTDASLMNLKLALPVSTSFMPVPLELVLSK